MTADRPRVRVNQVGYLTGRPMRATLVSDARQPLTFTLVDRDDAIVWSGRSLPWPVRPEPTSGLETHLLDFTAAGVEGAGMRLEVEGGPQSHPFSIGTDAYGRLAADALCVLRLLRSGAPLTDDVPAGYARPAGHAGRPPNRGDTAVAAWTGPDAQRLYPGWHCPGTFDVSGGWYDAGDYGKYVTSASIAVWQLLSTLDLLRTTAVGSHGLATAVLEECRWELDWLLRMQVPAGFPLAGMAFHRVHGTEWSPIPGWAHEDSTERVLHRPSTPATLQLAAAAAHGARYFGATDPAYADCLLAASRTAYAAATRHPMLSAPDDHARFGGGPYGDDDATDDRYWAASELWLSTGQQTYLEDVRTSPMHTVDVFDSAGFDFDRVAAPARIDLSLHGGDLPDHDAVRRSVIAAADDLLTLQSAQPWGQPYAPAEGWDWGSNGRILNNLVVLAVAARLTGDREYGDAVATGVDYLLGRNALGQSYITGYGTDYTRHQRTRQFGHDLDPDFPPPPPGALAGGANSRPHPDFPYDDRLTSLAAQLCYLDEPTSEVTNDICIRWQAPLVYVSCFLAPLPTPPWA